MCSKLWGLPGGTPIAPSAARFAGIGAGDSRFDQGVGRRLARAEGRGRAAVELAQGAAIFVLIARRAAHGERPFVEPGDQFSCSGLCGDPLRCARAAHFRCVQSGQANGLALDPDGVAIDHASGRGARYVGTAAPGDGGDVLTLRSGKVRNFDEALLAKAGDQRTEQDQEDERARTGQGRSPSGAPGFAPLALTEAWLDDGGTGTFARKAQDQMMSAIDAATVTAISATTVSCASSLGLPCGRLGGLGGGGAP